MTEDEKSANEKVEEELKESGEEGKSVVVNGSKEKDDSGNKGAKAKVDVVKSGKTFTQEQINRMMTKEKNQGKMAALKELGIDPKDPKMVAMVKALVGSQKTDEQILAENQKEEQLKVEEANRRALVAETKAEAMQLGVKTQYVEDIVTLTLAKMTDDSDLKTIIGEFKIKYPIWFGQSSDDEDENAKKGQKGTGSSMQTIDETKGKKNESLGARLAAQRKTSTKKTSYWGNK